jgi:hypothetical protein
MTTIDIPDGCKLAVVDTRAQWHEYVSFATAGDDASVRTVKTTEGVWPTLKQGEQVDYCRVVQEVM